MAAITADQEVSRNNVVCVAEAVIDDTVLIRVEMDPEVLAHGIATHRPTELWNAAFWQRYGVSCSHGVAESSPKNFAFGLYAHLTSLGING